MSKYLDIAEMVLEKALLPLSAKAILKIAYDADLVPKELYGKTQHKTLQARLSEDILTRRERSRFYRTSPGIFFLTKLLTDESIKKEYRDPMIARRRSRELLNEPVLSIKNSDKKGLSEVLQTYQSENINDHIQFIYDETDNPTLTSCWVMSIVTKTDHILAFRNGRYREKVDSFLNKKSIGFRAPIYDRHLQLFSRDTLGVYDAALESVNIDLDVSYSSVCSSMHDFQTEKLTVFKTRVKEKDNIVFVVKVSCPDWFEPVGKKLSINNLEWMPSHSIPNHVDDFDPWSKKVLGMVFN